MPWLGLAIPRRTNWIAVVAVVAVVMLSVLAALAQRAGATIADEDGDGDIEIDLGCTNPSLPCNPCPFPCAEPVPLGTQTPPAPFALFVCKVGVRDTGASVDKRILTPTECGTVGSDLFEHMDGLVDRVRNETPAGVKKCGVGLVSNPLLDKRDTVEVHYQARADTEGNPVGSRVPIIGRCLRGDPQRSADGYVNYESDLNSFD